MTDHIALFAALRASLLGPDLSQSEVGGVNALLAASKGWPLSWTAYLFATSYHETAHTLQPVKEMGGQVYFTRLYDPRGNNPALAKRLGNTQPGDGARYAGRGYVQITGRANYARASRELGLDFVANPDLMLQQGHAADVARLGMSQGWFTGKRLADYLPAGRGYQVGFTNARRIINGTDRAALIAGYALRFQDALTAGGYA